MSTSEKEVEVYVFEGGERIDLEEDTTYSCVWSKESILELLSKMYDHIADNMEVADWLVKEGDEGEGSITTRDTLELISDNLAQIVLCPEDGGMIYIVRK